MDNTSWMYIKQEPLGLDSIIMNNNSTEMLRIAKDGFYVRGIKVEQDANEAEKVYNAFHQWLTWATLNRDY